jgi:glycosyltransferase involved in cell wall biosynthesis
VSDIVAETDVVCLSSSAEACPYALLEAMALGRPCVATDAGAASEIIDDGVTGWVVPVGDATALAARLGDLLRNRDVSAACGLAGRRRWSARFTLDRQVAAVAALYESEMTQ